MSDPTVQQLEDGELRIFPPEHAEGDLGNMYVLDVLGVAVLIRERQDGIYIHVDSQDTVSEPPTTLLECTVALEVNNGGTAYFARSRFGQDNT